MRESEENLSRSGMDASQMESIPESNEVTDINSSIARYNIFTWGNQNKAFRNPLGINYPVEHMEEEQVGIAVQVALNPNVTFVLSETGTLFVQGESNNGLLGLGEGVTSTDLKALPLKIDISLKMEEFEQTDRFIDIKIGKNHALALTREGYVYAWGDNSKGQVGTPPSLEGKQNKKLGKRLTRAFKKGQIIKPEELGFNMSIYEPKQVFPTSDMKDFIRACQIEAIGDCSFVVTNMQTVYSWGDPSSGILGRESEQTLAQGKDISGKMTTLMIENHRLPRQMEINGSVQRIEVRETTMGPQLYAFQVSLIPEEETLADITQDIPDISIDSGMDEESKKVKENSDLKKDNPPPVKKRASMLGGRSLSRGTTNMSMRSGVNMSRMTNVSAMPQGQLGEQYMILKERVKNYDDLKVFLESTIVLQKELLGIDEFLEGKVEELLSRDPDPFKGIMKKDKNIVNDDDLFKLSLKCRISLKDTMREVQKVEEKLDTKEAEIGGGEEYEQFKKLLINILREALAFRKVLTVGAKFKTYHTRFKDINFLKMLNVLMANEEYNPENCKKPLRECQKICTHALRKMDALEDHIAQAHIGVTPLASFVMGFMTDVTYNEALLWTFVNQLSQYVTIFQHKYEEFLTLLGNVQKVWGIFKELERADFNKVYKSKRATRHQFTELEHFFDEIIVESNRLIDDSLSKLYDIARDIDRTNQGTVMQFIHKLLTEVALRGKMLNSSQQAIFALKTREKQLMEQLRQTSTKKNWWGGKEEETKGQDGPPNVGGEEDEDIEDEEDEEDDDINFNAAMNKGPRDLDDDDLSMDKFE